MCFGMSLILFLGWVHDGPFNLEICVLQCKEIFSDVLKTFV